MVVHRKTGHLAPFRYKVDGIGLAPAKMQLTIQGRHRAASPVAVFHKALRPMVLGLSRRIVTGWEGAYAGASRDRHADVPLVRRVQMIAPQTLKACLRRRESSFLVADALF